MAILRVIVLCVFGVLGFARPPERANLGLCHISKDFKCIYVFDLKDLKNLIPFCDSHNLKVPGPEHVTEIRNRLYWLNLSEAYFYTLKDGNYSRECDVYCNSTQNYPDQDFKGVCIGPRKPKFYCKPQFTLNEKFRACYHQAKEKLRNFYECRDYCREQGANPIVFDNYEQWQWAIHNFFKPSSKPYYSLESGYWSGHFTSNKIQDIANKEYMRKSMYTIDGSVIKRDDRFWRVNEPNAGGGLKRPEHCIQFWPHGERFNDYFCDRKILGCACRAVLDQSYLS